MTDTPNPDPNILAAEYVIGVLPRVERDAAARRAQQDPGFSAQVDWWAQKLEALNGGFVEQTPPTRIKTQIDRRLFTSRKRSWLPFAIMGPVFTALMLVITLAVFNSPQPPDLRAELRSDDTEHVFQVAIGDTLEIINTAGRLDKGRVYELWRLPQDGPPQSLGIFNAAAVFDLTGLDAGTTLAVSLEPAGGSTTGLPTGPVLAVGVLNEI